jgi:uncharacterized protein (DUF302 family)
MTEIGMKWTLKARYDDALAQVPERLKTEGFGVLTRIDVKATLKEKLGVDFRRYQILGACNPGLAHRALGTDLAVGVLLPCNVVVYEADDGTTVVTAVDPVKTLAGQDARFTALAGEVREKLVRALSGLSG